MRIVILHDKVPGRLRFSAPQLYRSRPVKQRVHQSLQTIDAIQSVRVNERTSRVLVLYDSGIAPDVMTAMVDQALEGILPEIVVPEITEAVNTAPLKEEVDLKESEVRPESVHKSSRKTSRKSSRKTSTKTTQTATTQWHSLPIAQVIERLQTDPAQGLVAGEVLARLEHYGPNAIGRQTHRSDLAILVEQFKSLPVAMLGVSAVVALATGGRVDAAVILGVVMINAGIGFVTERQAERTITSLGSMAPKRASVLREGRVESVKVKKIAPGDVLMLSPGSQVAADARLLSARRLTVDESTLTGESAPVSKRSDEGISQQTPLSDRKNMLHMGTVVTGGNASAVVVETGERTELGQIQALVDTTRPPETPLEKQLGQLSTQLGILSGSICAGIFFLGLLRGQPRLEMLKAAISLAVAAVPEGLTAVATTTLAMGIRDMNQRNVAVRKIEAVETLGSLQVLCLDKTGTLTRNHMTVVSAQMPGVEIDLEETCLVSEAIYAEDAEVDAWQELIKVVTLCNDTTIEDDRLAGSPTEVALLEFAQAQGIDVKALREQYPRVEVRERAEGRPLMSTVHKTPAGEYIAVKGRPAEILDRCSTLWRNGRLVSLDEESQQAILDVNERMAAQALRVLGMAYRVTDADSRRDAEDLTWLGLIGMQDPLRPGMAELMAKFHKAGIKTVMITGDQSATAYAIGQELGLSADRNLEILDSTRLDKLDPELLSGLVKRIDVFSRVSPAHKLRIVQALQEAGTVVAMTGDGINDGPALKAADIGVAMGEGGTDIARSVADVVIKDDNLHTMAVAVRQGRTIYANIRKTIHYLLSTNFSEIEIMLVSIAAGMGSPLNPMQLLWINLVTDIFPGLALSFEPASDDVMRQTSRPANTPIINKERLGVMAIESAFITASSLGAYLYGRSLGGPARGSTLAFHTLTFAQLIHVIACRSEQHSVFTVGALPRNKWLEKALVGTAVGQVATMFVPPMRRLMGTTPIGLVDAMVIAGGATVPLLVNELFKEIRQQKRIDLHTVSEPTEKELSHEE